MFLSMCIHLVKHLHPIWWNVSYYKSLLKMKRDHFGVIHLIRGLSDVICAGLFICLVGLIPRGGQVFSFVCDSISTGTSGQPGFSVNWGWHHFMELPIAPTCNLLSCFQNSKIQMDTKIGDPTSHQLNLLILFVSQQPTVSLIIWHL